jgi:transcriptional regulator with XRE-family HTH domain
VATGDTGPLIPRRRLGSAFRELRESRGETLQQTAKAVMFSPSKLSRIENGVAGEPHPRDVRDLINHFGLAETTDAAYLAELAEAGRRPGWWQAPPFEFGGDLDTFISYESAASRIREYSGTVVPGLLQTRAYAREVFTTFRPDLTAAEIEQLVDGRMERQRRLTRRPVRAPRLHVSPETILHRRVGSPATMFEQLTVLLEAQDDPTVDFRIIPYSSGLYEGVDLTTVTLFEFESSKDDDVVAIERIRHTEFIDRHRVVAKYEEILGRLSDYWLDESASRDFVERKLESWRDR